MKTSLDIALAHLRKHPTDYLFPLKALSKFPPLLKKNLSDNCSNDPAQIRAWAKQFPGCNWGIALRRSRLLVADVDVSKGKPGIETYRTLDMLYTWSETSRVKSTSGGYHCIYTGQHVMKIGGFGPAVDSPNYIVLAGMPVKDGRRYHYCNDLPRAEASAWMYEVLGRRDNIRVTDAREAVVDLDQPHNVASAIDFLIHDAVPAIEGEGGEYRTMKTAMVLRDLGISEDYALQLMIDHYDPRCEPGWEYDDLKVKVRNGFAYASMRAAGGSTAEADFSNEPEEPITPAIRAAARAWALVHRRKELGLKS